MEAELKLQKQVDALKSGNLSALDGIKDLVAVVEAAHQIAVEVEGEEKKDNEEGGRGDTSAAKYNPEWSEPASPAKPGLGPGAKHPHVQHQHPRAVKAEEGSKRSSLVAPVTPAINQEGQKANAHIRSPNDPQHLYELASPPKPVKFNIRNDGDSSSSRVLDNSFDERIPLVSKFRDDEKDREQDDLQVGKDSKLDDELDADLQMAIKLSKEVDNYYAQEDSALLKAGGSGKQGTGGGSPATGGFFSNYQQVKAIVNSAPVVPPSIPKLPPASIPHAAAAVPKGYMSANDALQKVGDADGAKDGEGVAALLSKYASAPIMGG